MKTNSQLPAVIPRLRFTHATILFSALLLGSPGKNGAATLSWSGGGGANANWNNSANWGFAGTPTTGDTLVFPASQPNLINTNNLVGLVLNQIRFAGVGGGYDIRGNPFTLTNGILANNSAGANAIQNNITLSTTTSTVNVAVNLSLNGALGGTGGLTKTGAGVLIFSGAQINTYAGPTTVSAGSLDLNRTSFDGSIPADLVIGAATTVRTLDDNQINNAGDITMNAGSTLDLGTFIEAVSNVTMTAATVTGSGALFNLLGTLTVNAAATQSSISKEFRVSATRTIDVANGSAVTDLLISGVVSGGGGIIKTGAGQLTLSGANTYTGVTSVNAGALNADDNLALGGTAGGTVVNGAAALLLNNAHVTNEVLTLNSANASGALQVNGTGDWIGPITLQADAVIEASSLLQLGGLISGPGGFTKVGASTLRLIGSSVNSYAGDTMVNGGTLELNVNANNGAIPGPLTINGAFTVRLLNNDQLNNDSVIAINTGGLLDLNGFSDVLGGLALTGGTAQSGAGGLLRLNGNLTVNASSTVSAITGQLQLFGAAIRTINISGGPATPDLDLPAIISGSGGITVNNSLVEFSRVVFSGANTYSGLTTLNGGSVAVQHALALGSAAVGTVLNGPNLVVTDVIVGEGLTNNSQSTLQGTIATGWTGPIVLNADLTLQVIGPGYVLDLSGVLSGTGGVKVTGAGVGPGAGIVIFSGASANTYTGNTFVQEGTLELAKVLALQNSASLVIGDGVGGAETDVVRYSANNCINTTVRITIDESGLLDLNGFSDTVGALTILGGNITTGAGTLTMNNNLLATFRGTGAAANIAGNLALGASTRTFTVTNTPGPGTADLVVTAAVSGTGGIIKAGDGLVVLSASNTFSGAITVNDGDVDLQDDFAAGTVAGGVTVNGDATLRLFGNINVGAEPLTLNSTATSGALNSRIVSNSWAGPVTLATDTIVAVSTADALNLLGSISGPGRLTKIGAGTLLFTGAGANTYTNVTAVNAGTLVLDKGALNGAIAGPLVVGDGVGGANADVVRLASVNQVVNTMPVTVAASGLYDMDSFGDAIGSFSGSGNVNLGGATLNIGFDDASTTFSGIISGTGSIDKYSGTTGTQTFSGNNTYTGTTAVNGGTLLVNGSQPQSHVTVGGAGTLGGTGTVGNINASGNVVPGTSPGTLTTSNLAFTAAGDFFVELNGTAAGTDYDRLNVRGTNNLGNAVLHVMPAFTTPVGIGDQFVIINNDGADAITGTFSGLPEGATVTAGFFTFAISYTGGSGNDVVLTLTSVPAVQAGASVTAGNGNHAIDPNECNQLSLVISNQSGVAMTDITAALSVVTPHVLVNQPASGYLDVPANGQGANLTPFQIATTPYFACGTDITLELTVATSSHGTFSIAFSLPSGLPGSVPLRYDVNVVTNIPDIGTIESTNTVAAFSGPLAKVAVSLWLTHALDADLNISLISPDGVEVDLSSGNGGGANFGTACAPDANRTTFDDAAGTPITAGSPPFIGTFRPEGSLAGLLGGSANGNWRLRVSDNFGGSLGALRCWSLLLYGPECTDGQGFCETCLGGVTGTITTGDPTNANRLARNGSAGTCAVPLPCGGEYNTTGPYHYDTYTFTNTGGPTCITVTLDTPCDDALSASAYLGSFSPSNLCANFLGEMGNNPSRMTDSFTVNVPGATNIVIVVNEVFAGSGCEYTLLLGSEDCVPTLVAEPVGAPPAVRIHWPSWAGGYNLEATTALSPATWQAVTNEPIVNGGRYNVTNQSPPAQRFYRLNKQLP